MASTPADGVVAAVPTGASGRACGHGHPRAEGMSCRGRRTGGRRSRWRGRPTSGSRWLVLHAEPYFEQFTQSETADPSTAREVTLGLSADSRQEVDELAERAVAARGRAVGDSVSQGPMYMRAFLDPDGHRW